MSRTLGESESQYIASSSRCEQLTESTLSLQKCHTVSGRTINC